MGEFDDIINHAAERCGGLAELEKELPHPKTNDELKAISDADGLSMMSRRIFRAGLKHSVVDAKWPAFEAVFHGFDPNRLSMLSDDEIDHFMQDKRIIRHLPKIKSVRSNAIAIQELHLDYDSLGSYLAGWPTNEIVALWEDLTKRFTHLGGMSGPYFLRMVGKDTFLFTNDVVKALNHWGVIQGEPKSKTMRKKVQHVFNDWQQLSQRPLCAISKILALSLD